MSERIERIRRAVEEMEGCEAQHVMSQPILELYNSQPVWDGVVEVFDLTNHPKADQDSFSPFRAYAWEAKNDKGDTEYTVVLGLPPIRTPRDAVKAAVVAYLKKNPIRP